MTVKIFGNTITNCGTAISAPANANLEIGQNAISQCQKAIELRDSPSLLQSLGLPPDTPIDMLREVLSTLAQSGDGTGERRQEIVKNSRLGKWLGTSANVAQIAGTFLTLHQGGYLQRILEILPR